MFTGLIEDLGTLVELRRSSEAAAITIATSLLMAELRIGDSVAVNGVCLTVTAFGSARFTADVSPETLEKSNLAQLQRGAHVNLERALRLGDRLGGHLVTGHVDGQGTILERTRRGNSWYLVFQCDAALSRLLVAKGSVAIDGISLTVNEAGDDRFSVMIIPHTLEQTTLAGCKVGDRVNIETDLVGKYVARLLGAADSRPRGVTLDLLAKSGFL